jgi:hypothetical protein
MRRRRSARGEWGYRFAGLICGWNRVIGRGGVWGDPALYTHKPSMVCTHVDYGDGERHDGR